jgi:hypothetical protein
MTKKIEHISQFYNEHSESNDDYTVQDVRDLAIEKVTDSYKNYPVYYKTNSCFGTVLAKRKNIHSKVLIFVLSYNDNNIFHDNNDQHAFISGYERIF